MADPKVTPALPRAQALDLAQIIREVNTAALECRANLPFPLPDVERVRR